MAAGAVRTIRLRGKCALSTGVALGATFPAVGGWIFEIPQPTAREPWRSDATLGSGYVLQEEITEGSPEGTDLVLGLNIRGDALRKFFFPMAFVPYHCKKSYTIVL
jgi:hypothetical protein